MGHRVVNKIEGYGPRKGLEGPFRFGNGQILYWDPSEGSYWDPKTDFYLSRQDTMDLWFKGN